MAKHLNISVSTVSRCLNNYPDVNAETRKKIYAAIEKLNYTPNAAARTITQKSTRTIGLTIPDIQDSFFAANAEAVEEVCRRQGYTLIYGSLARSAERLVEFLRRASEMRLDGVIITPDSWGEELLRTLSRLGMPIVVLRRKPPAGIDIPYVDTDQYGGARRMTEYLCDLGHRRIGHITLPTAMGKERLDGYLGVMRERGLEPAVASAASASGRLSDSIRNGAAAMAELWRGSPRPTAVFAASDLLAMGAKEFCDRNGLRVPEDVSLSGFDNLEYAAFHWFRFTTMGVDRGEAGSRAAEMLLRMITGKVKRPKSALLGTTLVIRSSTQPLH